MSAYDYCRAHGHVWAIIGEYSDDCRPDVVWQWQGCTRCGAKRKVARFHDQE